MRISDLSSVNSAFHVVTLREPLARYVSLWDYKAGCSLSIRGPAQHQREVRHAKNLIAEWQKKGVGRADVLSHAIAQGDDITMHLMGSTMMQFLIRRQCIDKALELNFKYMADDDWEYILAAAMRNLLRIDVVGTSENRLASLPLQIRYHANLSTDIPKSANVHGGIKSKLDTAAIKTITDSLSFKVDTHLYNFGKRVMSERIRCAEEGAPDCTCRVNVSAYELDLLHLPVNECDVFAI
jgi:hypothetical protein